MTPMMIPMMIPMMMMIMLRQVEFKHTNAKLDVKGLGGKIIQKLSNSVSKFATECLKSFVMVMSNGSSINSRDDDWDSAILMINNHGNEMIFLC